MYRPLTANPPKCATFVFIGRELQSFRLLDGVHSKPHNASYMILPNVGHIQNFEIEKNTSIEQWPTNA